MTDTVPTDAVQSARWTLIRDAAVLQVKLIVDGLRDFLLVPASIVATIISLAASKDGKPGPQFYDLLQLGKQSEVMINLFGAYKNAPNALADDDRFKDMNIDEIVGRVETFVVDEYRRGGMTAQAKEQIDKALNAIQRRRKKA
ncbi:MAG: hypothetical protein KJO82_12725 [Gammaproteobacteria bacterium]|nr:hypothetical protein [Gammaproteobacteria bacterium]